MGRVKAAMWKLRGHRSQAPPPSKPRAKSRFEQAVDEAARQLNGCKDSRKRGCIINTVAENYDVGTSALAQALSARAQARRKN